MNIAIYDLTKNRWSEKDGGVAPQIAFWRKEIAREEAYEGESDEFEKFIADNNLEA